MARNPVMRFMRVAEAFGDVAGRARDRDCESSGSEHSPESTMDLSDLVKSFIERDCSSTRGDHDDGGENHDHEVDGVDREGDQSESESYCGDSDVKDTLRGFLGCGDDEIRQKIRAEAEQAFRVIGISGPSPGPAPDFKRRLMSRLRDRGFDAGLCKSKWQRVGRFPSGSYEYIDVNFSGIRYIVEFSLASEFQIARPTESFTSLLQLFPPIFVGRVEELKKAVRLMCNAIKDSMKGMEMPVPPWRRFGYMKAKWFGTYKRTINEVPAKKGSDSASARKRSVGFVPSPLPSVISYYCREDFASKGGLRVGKLALAFQGGAGVLL